MVSMEQLQSRLTMIWFIGTGLILLTMIGMSVGGQFGSQTQAVWEWLTPNIMPTIGAIVSTLTATALQQDLPDRQVRKGFATVLQLLSIFYLLHLLVFIAGKQSIAIDTMHWMALLRLSNFWLSLLQAAMVPMLGVVFLTKRKADA
jgi:hypothetical protein